MVAPGSKLGPYEIVDVVGAGGMGHVYRARDTRLDRTVAIKVLPELTRADPQVRERFKREARVLASLDHPNICGLHDVGHADGIDFLVMPLLSGETLASRLARGPLPLVEALEIAGQIADALDRAHRLGIVHRDLKPANVMLTKTGVRVLDFGLARLDAATSEETELATRPALTEAGTMMGTLPYMAPEQVAGQAVDARADIWAFGCVLFEMLAGRRAYDGKTRSEVIAAVMGPPPARLTQVRPDLPPLLDEVVAVALEKDRDERWQSMRDVKRALVLASSVAMPAATVPASAASRPRLHPALWIGIGAAAASVLTAAVFIGFSRSPELAPTRFDIDVGGHGGIARFSDTNGYLAAAPDGTKVAFTAAVDGRTDIWIKRLDAEKPERLADTAGAISPFWSPDSKAIAFFAGGRLKRKALAEGPAETLCTVEGSGVDGTWSSTGVILIAEWNTRRLLRVADTGGTPVVVRKNDVAIGWPSFFPDGRHFLFGSLDASGNLAQMSVGSLDSAETVPIPNVRSRAEFVAGQLIFWREGSLMAQPFDDRSWRLSGQPVQIANQVHAFAVTGFAAFSATPNLLVYQAGPALERLVWLDRQGVELGTAGPDADYTAIRLSPDATSAAASVRDPRFGTNDIYILERGINRRLTSDPGTENGPAWSPDGKFLLYPADRHGPPSLQTRAVDGTGVEREVVPPGLSGPQSTVSVTPDGKSVIYAQQNPGMASDVMIAPLDGSAKPLPLIQTKANETAPRLSPNGTWIAYVSNQTGRGEVYVQPFAGERGRIQVSRDGAIQPRWRADGKELYFAGGPDRRSIVAVDITFEGGAIHSGEPRVLFTRDDRAIDYDVTPDGKKFLLAAPDPIAERGTLSVVANWMKLLGR